MVLFSFSISISEIMLVLLACARACQPSPGPLFWLGRYWPASVNARNDPLPVLMRCAQASFAFCTEPKALSVSDRCYIYDTALNVITKYCGGSEIVVIFRKIPTA